MVKVNEVPLLSHISIKIGVLIATLHYFLLEKLDLTGNAVLFTELFVSAALFLVVFWKRSGDLGVIRWGVYYCIHFTSITAVPYLSSYAYLKELLPTT